MPVRSIIDLDIDDRKFLAFKRHFDQLQDSLKKMPAAWGAITSKISGTRGGLEKVVEEATAARSQASLFSEAVEEASKHTTHSAARWGAIAEGAKKAAGHVQVMTRNFLAWTGIGGGTFTGHGGLLRLLAFGGGLAFGTTFGIDRLAGAAAQRRQQALALGSSYGGVTSTEAAFGRFGGPDYLQRVAGARYDISQRVGLLGAGLSQGEMTGDTAQVGVALLRRLKALADNTDPRFFAQVIQARKLENLTSPEQLALLRNTSQGEVERQIGQQQEFTQKLRIDDPTLKKWQDLTTQLDFAGKLINKVFVEGLVQLAVPMQKLSISVTDVMKSFVDAAVKSHWVEQLSDAMENLAKTIGSDDFGSSVKGFVSSVTTISGYAQSLAGFLSKILPDNSDKGSTILQFGAPSWWNAAKNVFSGSWSLLGVNNPGNMRVPGISSGFANYGSPEQGVQAMARQLQIYENRDHLDTLASIIGKYAPASENDTAAYVADVSKRTGYGAGAHLDLNNPEILAKVVAAMVAHEQGGGHYEKYKDAKVVVTILDHTGANVVSTVNGMKTGGGP
jgi:hypothetical protein